MGRRRAPGPGPDDLDADLVTEPLDAAPAALADGALAAELDLHTFAPRECADLVGEYVTAAAAAGLRHVRVVHGKGTGALRRLVHAVLARHPAVVGYRLADERAGGWGATVVELTAPP